MIRNFLLVVALTNKSFASSLVKLYHRQVDIFVPKTKHFNLLFYLLAMRSIMNENLTSPSPHLSGELISCSLQKGHHGFGFTIIDGNEKGEHFLQIKDILPDGPAARDGKLCRGNILYFVFSIKDLLSKHFILGDILVYVNDINVLGFSHTDVVRIFQSLSINDIIRLTVCRGYPLAVNFDDPQIDVVSLNGIHNSVSVNNLPNGGYTEYQPDIHQHNAPRIHTIKIRKGDNGFGFTVADSPSGQRVKAIVAKQRCENLRENDLLLSINGQDLTGKQHADVVDILVKCPKDIETIFVIRRGRNNGAFSLIVNVVFFFHFTISLIVNEETTRRELCPFIPKRTRENDTCICNRTQH